MSDKPNKGPTPEDAFIAVTVGMLKAVATTRSLMQMVVQIDAGRGLQQVRVIMAPEDMEQKWPKYAPLGTPTKGN